MLVCGCGRWMHTEGIEERAGDGHRPLWFVRWECRGCAWRVGLESPQDQAETLVDRLMWTDEARHRVERFPPYVAPLVQQHIESFARTQSWRVVSYDRLAQAQMGEPLMWDAEAERRLMNVPAAVRAMARVELERTAMDRALSTVTVALMEEVKARYFGMGQQTQAPRM